MANSYNVEPEPDKSRPETLLQQFAQAFTRSHEYRERPIENQAPQKRTPGESKETPLFAETDTAIKANKLDRAITVGTLLFVGLTALFAGRQWSSMERTYGEIKKQTSEAQKAAYTACVNAQIAQATLVQFQRSTSDSHAVAFATVKQTMASIETQSSYVSFLPRMPVPEDFFKDQLAIPYSVKNEGHSPASDVSIKAQAVILNDDEKLVISRKIPDVIGFKRFTAGDEFPEKPRDSNSNPYTKSIQVLDAKGHVVSASSQEAHDFLNGGHERVIIYGDVSWVDFSGNHSTRFCGPMFKMQAGTIHTQSDNETTCIKYGKQTDVYSDMPGIAQYSADPSSDIKPITCLKP